MSNPPTLNKLNFSEIKASLTEYLKNQDIFVGYEFEGSAIQTVIDLLSYNTYYYAFYSNMMINEMFLDTARRATSVVSLVKPLGYTVPGKKSARATIELTTDDTTIPRYTLFSGVFSSGKYYSFFNETVIAVNETATFSITEARTVVENMDVTDKFDFVAQRYIIDESEIDISTIRVEISPSTADAWVEWENVNFFPNNDQEIFYIERYGDIFTIQLGKENNLGKSLDSEDHKIRISYLISSGSEGNEIFSFSTTVGSVSVVESSAGGGDGPDLELIKFAAPKAFSAQERAVTKNDYYGLLIRNNFFSDISEFVVYGGEEIYPPKYGRVFISFNSEDASITDVLDFLKFKNVLTVLPEYVKPREVATNIMASFEFSQSLSLMQKNTLQLDIQAFFNLNYGSGTSKFGISFNFHSFRIATISKFASRGLIDVVLNNISYSTTLSAAHLRHEVALQNSIVYGSVAISPSFTSIFDSKKMIIKLPVRTSFASATLDVFEVLTNGSLVRRVDIDAGSVYWEKGYLEIRSIFSSDLLITIPSNNSIISTMTNTLSKLSLKQV